MTIIVSVSCAAEALKAKVTEQTLKSFEPHRVVSRLKSAVAAFRF